jgi:hypothetical protein
MSDGSLELQTELSELLLALSPPLVSGNRITTDNPAPQDYKVPFVQIGESDSVPSDVQCRSGLNETVTIHVWTEPGSQKEVKDIISRIRGALHAQKLTVSGRSAALAFIGSTRFFTDDDGESIHGVVTLNVNHFGQLET